MSSEDEGLARAISKSVADGHEDALIQVVDSGLSDPGLHPTNFEQIVEMLGRHHRYATIGEMIRRHGIRFHRHCVLTYVKIDWAEVCAAMKKRGTLGMQMVDNDSTTVESWMLLDLCYSGAAASTVIACGDHVTVNVLEMLLNMPGAVMGLCKNSSEMQKDRCAVIRALHKTAWSQNKTDVSWAPIMHKIAVEISIELAVALSREHRMGLDETEFSHYALPRCANHVKRMPARHSDCELEAWLVRRVSENTINIDAPQLVQLATELWLELAAEALRACRRNQIMLSDATRTELSYAPLRRILNWYDDEPWPIWIRFKKDALRHFGHPDLRGRCIELVNPAASVMGASTGSQSDIALRIFGGWHPIVDDVVGWRALYTEKAVALLDLLRQMERLARRGDLCAHPSRSLSIRDFFLLVRDYL